MDMYLPLKFYANFNNIAIMVWEIDYKLGRLKNWLRQFLFLLRSIIAENTLFFLPSLKIKQNKSLDFFAMVGSLMASILACISLIPTQINITAFEQVTLLQT